MIVDAMASLLCFIFAISTFVIHVLSNPRRGNWVNLPPYVRVGFFVSGAAMMFWGVNLAALSGEVPPTSPGHINTSGLTALTILTYTLSALAIYVLRRTYPSRVWIRLNHIEHLACCSRGGTLAVLASLGFKVTAPNAPPEAVRDAVAETDFVR